MATPEKHALLSASSSHRWLKCTAAPRFEAQFPAGPVSDYAAEGTLAHSICELYAKKKFSVMTNRKFNSELKKLQAKPYYDPEMLKTAEVYVEYLTSKAMTYEATPYVAQEVRVDFSEYVPDGFGTCDCIMIGGDLLHITDYKHGKGVAVSAEKNSQMLLYALGALKMFQPIYGDAIKRVSMGICQPRISTEDNEDCLTVEELLAWGESIKPTAKEAFDGPGTFCPGDHCRFCRGKAQCRARANVNTALEEFKNCVPEGKVAPELRGLTPEARQLVGLPPVLTDAEIGELLERGKGLVKWFEDLQAYALGAILGGGEIPGFKVVEGRSTRAFDDAEAALQCIEAAGYERALLYDYKPKTLTELEKLMGKKAFADTVGGHIIKPPGKPTLAPASDKRQSYSPAAADFAGVPGTE